MNTSTKTRKAQKKTTVNTLPLLEIPSNLTVKSRMDTDACVIHGAVPLPWTIAMLAKKNIKIHPPNIDAYLMAMKNAFKIDLLVDMFIACHRMPLGFLLQIQDESSCSMPHFHLKRCHMLF